MNQQCKVCGEPAAGFHFGAFTCEGCKSFFGRTYNNLSSISECKNNGECVINKKNRTACKACRLRKCLLVGMSKSGSRYGRRSNWFKIHCLLQEQQQTSQIPQIPQLYSGNFLPTHLIGLCKQENRQTSSPSDSGASSVDPEEDTSSFSSYKNYSNKSNEFIVKEYKKDVTAFPPTLLPEQEEPIDLSIRPREIAPPEIFKPAPLDLTLVTKRTNKVPISG